MSLGFLANSQITEDFIKGPQTWLAYEIRPEEKNLFIKEYKSSPIDVELTFITRSKLDLSEAGETSAVMEKLMKFGLTLVNLEKASVKLNAISLTNIFGSQDDISLHFKMHYIQLLKANIFRLVG